MALAVWRFALRALGAGLCGAGLCGAGLCDIAAAADLPPAAPVPAPTAPATYVPETPDWLVTIGAEVRAVPAWAGAPTTRFAPTGFPLFTVQRPGDPPFFFGARDGFGFPIFSFGTLQFGPVGKLVFPRYENQYRELNGLGDVPWALQAGGYAIWYPLPWLRLRGEVRQGFDGETGVTGDVFMDAIVPLGQWRLSAGPRITAQTSAAVSPYFSITATQSANSGVSGLAPLPVFSASGGLYSYGAGGQVEYFWGREWSAHAIVEYERLTGSVADSPLVTMRGSPNQLTFGVGATYTFAMRPLW